MQILVVGYPIAICVAVQGIVLDNRVWRLKTAYLKNAEFRIENGEVNRDNITVFIRVNRGQHEETKPISEAYATVCHSCGSRNPGSRRTWIPHQSLP